MNFTYLMTSWHLPRKDVIRHLMKNYWHLKELGEVELISFKSKVDHAAELSTLPIVFRWFKLGIMGTNGNLDGKGVESRDRAGVNTHFKPILMSYS